MEKINYEIDLNLYKTFYAVAQNKSFSKASEEIYISQPAISYSINKLEKQLGVKLFYRTTKGALLTPEGEELFGFVKTAYEYIYLGEQSIRNSKELISGTIRIGVPTHIGDFYLTKKVKDFHSKYPNILFSIQSRPTADMVYMLETHRLDFIIDSYPINKNKACDLRYLYGSLYLYSAHTVEEEYIINRPNKDKIITDSIKLLLIFFILSSLLKYMLFYIKKHINDVL